MLIKKTIREYPYLTLEESNIIENNHINTIDSSIVEDVDIILDPYSITNKDNIRVYHKESLYDYLCEDILEQVENDELLLEDIDNIIDSVILKEETNQFSGMHSRTKDGVFSYSYRPDLNDPDSFNKIDITTPEGKKQITFKQLESIKNYIIQTRKHRDDSRKEQGSAFDKANIISRRLMHNNIQPSEKFRASVGVHIKNAQDSLDKFDYSLNNPPDEIRNLMSERWLRSLIADKNEGDTMLQAYYAVRRQNKELAKRKKIKISKNGVITISKQNNSTGNNLPKTEVEDTPKRVVSSDNKNTEISQPSDNSTKTSTNINKKDAIDKNIEDYHEIINNPSSENPDNTNYILRRGLALGAGAAGAYAIARKIASLKNIQNKYVRKLLLLPPAKRGKLQRIIDKIKQVIARLGKRLHK